MILYTHQNTDTKVFATDKFMAYYSINEDNNDDAVNKTCNIHLCPVIVLHDHMYAILYDLTRLTDVLIEDADNCALDLITEYSKSCCYSCWSTDTGAKDTSMNVIFRNQDVIMFTIYHFDTDTKTYVMCYLNNLKWDDDFVSNDYSVLNVSFGMISDDNRLATGTAMLKFLHVNLTNSWTICKLDEEDKNS